ncbi:histone H1-like [Tachysurus fulvidraco]|uniref:histone H1-like n=1 Tax=Tachysurus fulvidraco TaxID=1234273 RepID=UPI001FEDB253|nr:histone H1-like [Tachysurus fulvidraco]
MAGWDVCVKERSGMSLSTLKKALFAGGYDVEKNNSRVKLAIKGLVTKGTHVQTKGTGGSGSFKLNKKQTEVKKAAPKATKPGRQKVVSQEDEQACRCRQESHQKPKVTKKIKAVKSKTSKPKAAKIKEVNVFLLFFTPQTALLRATHIFP